MRLLIAIILLSLVACTVPVPESNASTAVRDDVREDLPVADDMAEEAVAPLVEIAAENGSAEPVLVPEPSENATVEPRASMAEFVFSRAGQGVKATMHEGERVDWVNITLLFVGYDAAGELAARFEIDGEEVILGEDEDAYIAGGYLYVRDLVPPRNP